MTRQAVSTNGATHNPALDGEHEGANPETLLASAIATCYSITLGYLASRYGFESVRVAYLGV